MAIGWFITGYNIVPDFHGNLALRVCMMDEFTAQIVANGGDWRESEVLGGNAIVKVRASDTVLTTIAGTTGFQRIPSGFVNLTDGLTTLTNAQKSVLTARILQMGYTQAELDAVMGTTLAAWRTRTLGDLLHFIAQRRLLARWNGVSIVLDGPSIPASVSIEILDTEVTT